MEGPSCAAVEEIEFAMVFASLGPCGISCGSSHPRRQATDGAGWAVAFVAALKPGSAVATRVAAITGLAPGAVLGEWVKGRAYEGVLADIKATRPLELGFCGLMPPPLTSAENSMVVIFAGHHLYFH